MTPSAPATSTPAGPAASLPAAARQGGPGKAIFFLVMLVILIGFTEMAFGMDWVTKSGQIGAGFFPRFTGVLGSLVAAWAVWNGFRHPEDELGLEEEVGEAELGRHPVAMLVAIAASIFLLVTLTALGAIVASAIFMFALLGYLNRGRWVLNATLSVAVPLGMYLLLQTALNAGLPSGILPRF